MAFFDYMDRSQLKPFHTRIQLLASMGMFLDGYDLSVITMAIILIPHQLDLSSVQYILVNVSAFVGMIVGAPILGKLSDRIGRKKIFGIDLFFFTIFAIISGLSMNFYMLFISRFMLGIGIGGDYPISSTMVAEFSPSERRGRMLFGMVGMYWLGSLFSGAMNYAFAYTLYFWRYTFIIGGLISIPIIFLRMQVPESPRWLISHGKLREAESIVYEMTGKYPDPGEGRTEMEAEDKISFRDLFRNKYLYTTIFVLSVWFLFDVAAYGIGFYYPLVISEMGLKSAMINTAGLRTVARSSIIISLGAIAGYAIALPLADRAGRRFLTVSGFLIMSFLLFLGSLIKISGLLYVVPFFFSFVLFEQWVGAATLFYPTELYPTNYRSTVQGISTSVSRIGAVMGVIIFPFFTVFHSLMIFAFVSLAALITSVLLAPETKNISLEKIWRSRNKSEKKI